MASGPVDLGKLRFGNLPIVMALSASLALGTPITAQQAEDSHPLSACFHVTSIGDSAPSQLASAENGDAPEQVDEIVEFIFDPAHATDAGAEEPWRLNTPPHAESVAFWWTEGDYLVAIWSLKGRLRTLRMLALEDVLVGSVIETLPPNAELGDVQAKPITCPETPPSE